MLNLQKSKFDKVEREVENDPHNGNFKKIEDTSENYGHSKYSFEDEDKPSRVKVIRRDKSSQR